MNGIRRMAAIMRCITWPFFVGQRKIIMSNLRIAFPEKSEKELKNIARQNVQYMMEMALEVIHGMKHPEFFDERLPQIDFPSELEDRSRPEIWFSAHMGCWEAMAHIKNAIGKSGGIVTSEFDYAPLDRAIKRMRSYKGTEIIIDKGAAAGCERNMKQNRGIGILIDQNISPKHGGEFIDFFGLPAPTSKMPAAMARKFDAPCVVCNCIRQNDGTLRREIRIVSLHPATEYSDELTLTQDIFRAYEDIIRQYPEQYLWMYRKWRYIPGNLDDEARRRFPFYAKVYREYFLKNK